jgi:transcription elongation factor Elf1
MLITKSRLVFARRMLSHLLARQECCCPYCGETSDLELLGRKKVLLQVLRCSRCRLIFRYPLDSTADNSAYYQDVYQSGATTRMPQPPELANMLAARFRGCGSLDIWEKIQVLKALSTTLSESVNV